MKKQLHVKNHYVPESYLKRWTNSENKIFVYRTLVNHSNVQVWKDYSVAAIAYQKNLYTQIISGNESDELESWLDREFESPASNALEKATNEARLTKTDWEDLIKFLAAQDVRTPARLYEYIKRAEKELPSTLDNIMDDVLTKLKSGNIGNLKQKENEQILKPFPLKITTHIEGGADTGLLKAETYVGRSTWIYSIRHLLENTRKVLNNHNWTIVKPAKGYFWPTSDNPVVKLNYYKPGKYDLKGGWDVNKGNIFFPIDPEHAMFVQIGERTLQKNSRLPEKLTNELIGFILQNSHRKIFSHIEDSKIPKIKKRDIDPKRLSKENDEIKNWHTSNAVLERDYITNNRSVTEPIKKIIGLHSPYLK